MFEQAVALTTVRPVLTVLRTVRMTMAAARASRPAMGICMLSQLRSTGSQAAKVAHDPPEAKEYKQPRAASSVRPAADNRPGQAVHAGRQFAPEVGSSMNTMEGLATCRTAQGLEFRLHTSGRKNGPGSLAHDSPMQGVSLIAVCWITYSM